MIMRLIKPVPDLFQFMRLNICVSTDFHEGTIIFWFSFKLEWVVDHTKVSSRRQFVEISIHFHHT